jgi:filamentous hemagglutinin family protein
MSTRWGWFLLIAMGGMFPFFGNCANAQIAPDSTLPNNSNVTPDGSTFNITGGTEAGGNLFHSFKEFSVPTGGAAFFNNGVDIQNIISRVTGGSVSNIDGLIKANGTANLFLINPNGIIFGQNARLNIGGSFIGSTASSLKFADGFEFSAKTPQTTPLLTISVPIGLQFGESAGDIRVQESELFVPFNKTLALVGGNVTLEGKVILAAGNENGFGGQIELGSVARTSLVSLIPKNQGWSLGYEGVKNFLDIELSQGYNFYNLPLNYPLSYMYPDTNVQIVGRRVSFNDTYLPSGNLTILSKQFYAKNAFLTANENIFSNSGDIVEGKLFLTASESLELNNTTFLANNHLAINTNKLTLRDNSAVSVSSSFNNSAYLILNDKINPPEVRELQGGNLTVSAESVELDNSLLSASGGASAGGSVLENGSVSNIDVRFHSPGNITIDTGKLIARNGGRILLTSFGQFPGGNLTINASKFIELTGTRFKGDYLFSSGIEAGYIGSEPLKSILQHYGFDISAFKLLPIEGGNVVINTPQLSIEDGASVKVSTLESGNAGNINISARSVFLNRGELLAQTDSGFGGNITIQAQDLLILRNNSLVSTNAGTAQQPGDGGNITINAPNGFIVAKRGENSDITANAFSGSGGRITIKATNIFGIAPLSRQELERLSPNDLDPSKLQTNDITAISQTNPSLSGTIELNTPDIDPNTSLINLPSVPVDTEVAQSCTAGSSIAKSSFIITGRGGLPPNPGEPLNTDAVQVDLITLNPISDNRNSPTVTSKTTTAAPERIVEATGWIINEKGEVVLIANSPTTTPHSPSFNPASCSAS